MKLVTSANTRAPAGYTVCVVVWPDGLEKPLPTPHYGDDRAAVEERARVEGLKAEAFLRKQAATRKAAAAKAAARRQARK